MRRRWSGYMLSPMLAGALAETATTATTATGVTETGTTETGTTETETETSAAIGVPCPTSESAIETETTGAETETPLPCEPTLDATAATTPSFTPGPRAIASSRPWCFLELADD